MRRFPLLLAVVALLPGVARGQGGAGTTEKASIYEGWRQYSVHCARCHGQDVLGNPVAANLLVTTAPGGTTAGREAFLSVVAKGRTGRGMPAFSETMSPDQMEAVYAYVKGRAEKKVPPGRPKQPAG